MGRPLTILFQHHKTDPLTCRRAAGLARRNPGVPIVPLTMGSADVLAGTFDAAGMPGLPVEHPWSGADLALYAWFRYGRTPQTTADRYAVVEYDLLYTVPLSEFYLPVWHADLATAQLVRA